MQSAGTAAQRLYPRFAESRLKEALADTPVVLIHGPRQCGKTTLAQQLGTKAGYAYKSFDDEVTLAAAKFDPIGFVAELPPKCILDEVQRAPGIFSTLKMAVDENRAPGRFLLTVSANVLMVPALSDSLAGRMGIQRLYPLAQCELAGHPAPLLDLLFGGRFPARKRPRRRAVWYRDYVETMVQRDVRDLARIASLDSLPRLLKLAAGQTARLINVSDLGAPLQLSRPTIRDYVTLLEGIFLLDELPPWHSNRMSRLIKTPKLHVGDTGIACALLDRDAAALWDHRVLPGQMLETFVYQELRRHGNVRT